MLLLGITTALFANSQAMDVAFDLAAANSEISAKREAQVDKAALQEANAKVPPADRPALKLGDSVSVAPLFSGLSGGVRLRLRL